MASTGDYKTKVYKKERKKHMKLLVKLFCKLARVVMHIKVNYCLLYYEISGTD